jgi:uncharacterized surface protein with fasciclin (FAS1) repeats
MMRNRVFIFASVIASMILFGGCESEPEIKKQPFSERSVLDVIRANGYTSFAEAVTLAGLETELETNTQQTIFAPNNNAFSVLLQQLGVVTLAEIDVSVLQDVLRYHITDDGSFLAADLPRKLSTIAGGSIYVTGPSTARSINSKSNVILTNRSGKNGVFHGINLVLQEPTLSIYDAIEARTLGSPAEFTLLKHAIDRVGLDDDLQTGDFTLFAPTNAAFTTAGLGTTAAIDAFDLAALEARLKFHVLPAATYSADLVTSRVATLIGPVAGSVKGADINAATPAFETGTITVVNNLATNGVWHQINALVLPKVSIKDGITLPGVNIWSTTNDALGPDAFGALVSASGYTRFNDINRAAKDVIYFPRVPPAAGTFATNDDIIDYLERHIFASGTNIPTAANGTKITSVGGDSYFVAVREDGRRLVNGLIGNAFTDQTSSRVVYDGTIFIWGPTGFTGLSPLPDKSIVEVLEEDSDFELIVAAIEKAGRKELLETGDKTFFAVDNAVFSAFTGLTSVAQIEALDESNEDDLETINELAEVIDRHTVASVQFAVTLQSSLPKLKNILNEDITLGEVGGNTVIIENVQLPESNFAGFDSFDLFLAKNGVIHVLDKVLEFE